MTLKNDKDTFFKCHGAVIGCSVCERLRHGGCEEVEVVRLRSS